MSGKKIFENAHFSISKFDFIGIKGKSGIGKRLMPLTKNVPKPMIKVANKPIIQHIIDSASSNGFYNFYICGNALSWLGQRQLIV